MFQSQIQSPKSTCVGVTAAPEAHCFLIQPRMLIFQTLEFCPCPVYPWFTSMVLDFLVPLSLALCQESRVRRRKRRRRTRRRRKGRRDKLYVRRRTNLGVEKYWMRFLVSSEQAGSLCVDACSYTCEDKLITGLYKVTKLIFRFELESDQLW